METLGFTLKKMRLEKKISAKETAAFLRVDSSYISKIENDKRVPTEEQIVLLSEFYSTSAEVLLKLWLSIKIINELKSYSFAKDVLSIVGESDEIANIRKTIVFNPRINGLIDQIDQLKQKLDYVRAKKNSKIVEALKMEYIYESNRIEGNTLSLQETDLIINHGITIGGKSVNEHLEAINHHDAIDYIKELVDRKTELNEREILSIHSLILRGIQSKEAGKYRNTEVLITGSSHEPPSWLHVKDEMKLLMKYYYEQKDSLHPIILAAEMHQKLVSIHPFVDGNGRTSRLVMNAILLQHGYVIANIKGDSETRINYYTSLEKSRSEGKTDAFIEFIAETEKQCMERYLKLIGV